MYLTAPLWNPSRLQASFANGAPTATPYGRIRKTELGVMLLMCQYSYQVLALSQQPCTYAVIATPYAWQAMCKCQGTIIPNRTLCPRFEAALSPTLALVMP